MARPLRIHPPGGYHHVTARGNDRLPIFLDDRDRWSFLRLLADANARFGCEIHAYCLMTNHIHLVVEDHHGNLSSMMRHVKGVHAQRFNRDHHRVGHLFEGRFWNSLLGDDTYLATAIEYVHRNPVEAGIVGRARDYPWSSYPALLQISAAPSCLTLSTVLRLYGGRAALAQRTEAPPNLTGPLSEFLIDQPSPVRGTTAFCRDVLAETPTAPETRASADRGFRQAAPALPCIGDAVAMEWGVAVEELRTGKRGAKNTARSVAVHLAHDAGISIAEVASFFGLGSSNAVSVTSARTRRRCAEDPTLAQRVLRLRQIIESVVTDET